jgi:hypothetical protein
MKSPLAIRPIFHHLEPRSDSHIFLCVLAAGIMAPVGNHSFRATGITAYLANGGTLEHAQAMAALRPHPGAAHAR